MTIDDYDMIINQGYEAFMFQHLPKVIDMQVFQEGMAQVAQFSPTMGQKSYEHGLGNPGWRHYFRFHLNFFAERAP